MYFKALIPITCESVKENLQMLLNERLYGRQITLDYAGKGPCEREAKGQRKEKMLPSWL